LTAHYHYAYPCSSQDARMQTCMHYAPCAPHSHSHSSSSWLLSSQAQALALALALTPKPIMHVIHGCICLAWPEHTNMADCNNCKQITFSSIRNLDLLWCRLFKMLTLPTNDNLVVITPCAGPRLGDQHLMLPRICAEHQKNKFLVHHPIF